MYPLLSRLNPGLLRSGSLATIHLVSSLQKKISVLLPIKTIQIDINALCYAQILCNVESKRSS
jgi:hypothetical protein